MPSQLRTKEGTAWGFKGTSWGSTIALAAFRPASGPFPLSGYFHPLLVQRCFAIPHATHRHLHTLPWSQSADSAGRADPPSQPLPWPGRFLPRFLARGRGLGRGGAAGCRRRARSSLAPAAMMGVGGRGDCRKKSGCPDKLIGAFILPFAQWCHLGKL